MSLSKTICDIAVATSTVWAMWRMDFMHSHIYFFIAEAIQLSHAIFGIVKHGAGKEAADEAHYNGYELSVIFALPLFTAEIHDHYDVHWAAPLAHVALCYIPFCYNPYRRGQNENYIAEGIVGVNIVSVATVAALNQNYFAIGAAAIFSLGYYLVGTSPGEEYQGYNCKDLFHYFLTIFNLIAVEAIMD